MREMAEFNPRTYCPKRRENVERRIVCVSCDDHCTWCPRLKRKVLINAVCSTCEHCRTDISYKPCRLKNRYL